MGMAVQPAFLPVVFLFLRRSAGWCVSVNLKPAISGLIKRPVRHSFWQVEHGGLSGRLWVAGVIS